MQQNDTFILSRRGFLILAGGALAFAALPAGFANAAADVDPTELFNQIRKANGLSLMATDSKLEQAALYQARRRKPVHHRRGSKIPAGKE